MRASVAVLLFVGLIGCVGCTVESLKPFFDQEDCILDSRLPGAWSAEDVTVVVRLDSDSLGYDVFWIVEREESASRFHARLARVEGNYFLEIGPPSVPTDYFWTTAMYQLYRIKIEDNRLSLRVSEDEEMASLLEPAERDSSYYEGILVPSGGSKNEYDPARLLMVSSTSSLWDFLVKCVKHDEFWSKEELKFERLK